MNPGTRPRRGAAFVLAAGLIGALVAGAAIVATPEEAEASGLTRFTSCRELAQWGTDVQQQGAQFDEVGALVEADVAMSAEAAPATTATVADAANGASARSNEAGSGETNVAVAGVDELDLVDRLSGDRILVASNAELAIVDLAAGEVLDELPVSYGAQITYDAERSIAWVVGFAEAADGGVSVRRISVGDGALSEEGEWQAKGQLVDARRIGGELFVVASDGFGWAGPIPFDGGPVPCDEVLRPAGPSDPTASLIVALPADGDLQPTRATEVVGSGQLVHMTTDAAYLATPQWADDGLSTTIHRFELSDLEHTGSGRVPGSLLNDFSMSEDGGHLRVAVTAGGGVGFGGGRMIAVDDMVLEDEGFGRATESVEPLPPATPSTQVPEDPTTTVPGTSVPETTVPETTVPETTVPDTTVPETTTTTSTTTTSTTTTTAPTLPPVEQPGPDDPFNRVVVLDTEGDLDVVGQTDWFGHPGESLEGIRFEGDTAYAVTFLQTDPFYVVDLADPANPRIAGEVELPGFSAYLHPIGDETVVGFGPDGNGRTAAKLFDVSNPAAPKVVDTIALGDESPVVYDHHAFVSLDDDTFAVPFSSWSAVTNDCVVPDDLGPLEDIGCAPGSPDAGVVTLEVSGNRMSEVERITTEVPGYDQVARAIPTDDGWALLTNASLVLVDGAGNVQSTISLG